jgi:hypothetical protein
MMREMIPKFTSNSARTRGSQLVTNATKYVLALGAGRAAAQLKNSRVRDDCDSPSCREMIG